MVKERGLIMKEKIKKFLCAVFSYKGAAWVNIVCCAMILFLAICQGELNLAFIGFPHLMYAAFFGMLHLEKEEATLYRNRYICWRTLAEMITEHYERYRKLYGELPPEEEAKEEEKKEEE